MTQGIHDNRAFIMTAGEKTDQLSSVIKEYGKN